MGIKIGGGGAPAGMVFVLGTLSEPGLGAGSELAGLGPLSLESSQVSSGDPRESRVAVHVAQASTPLSMCRKTPDVSSDRRKIPRLRCARNTDASVQMNKFDQCLIHIQVAISKCASADRLRGQARLVVTFADATAAVKK